MAYKTFVNGFPLNASEINNNLMNQSIATFADAAARTAAIAAPVEGQVTYLESDESYYKFDGTSWVALRGMTPNAIAQSGNYVINGAFDFWQRGTSFTTNSAYTADRWQMNLSGATSTVSRQSFTAGQTDVPNNPTYFLRMATSVGDNNSRIQTNLEDVNTLSNQQVTVSFYAKGTNPGLGSFAVNFAQNFGSGGSAAVDVVVGTLAVSASWARYSYTFTVPSVAGKTIGTTSYIAFDIRQANADTSTSAWTLDLSNFQVELGNIATPFKRNANSLQGELAACQRYYERVGIGGVGAILASNIVELAIKYQPKRTTPTVALTTTSPQIYDPQSGTKTASSAAISLPVLAGVNGSVVSINGYSGLVANRIAYGINLDFVEVISEI